jgi:hypothetical protein
MPQAETVSAPSIPNMRLSRWAVFGMGAVAGAVSFVVANSTIPVGSPSQHDLILAHHIGYIFPAMAGLWAGWIQKSLARMIAGMMCGSMVGWAYATLCGDEFNFFAIMMGYPAICGGGLALLIGSNRDDWLAGSLGRLWRGTVAGLVCGIVYMVALNIGMAFFISWPLVDETYCRAIWKAGPPALALGGGLFFLLLRWALRLSQPASEQ